MEKRNKVIIDLDNTSRIKLLHDMTGCFVNDQIALIDLDKVTATSRREMASLVKETFSSIACCGYTYLMMQRQIKIVCDKEPELVQWLYDKMEYSYLMTKEIFGASRFPDESKQKKKKFKNLDELYGFLPDGLFRVRDIVQSTGLSHSWIGKQLAMLCAQRRLKKFKVKSTYTYVKV